MSEQEQAVATEAAPAKPQRPNAPPAHLERSSQPNDSDDDVLDRILGETQPTEVDRLNEAVEARASGKKIEESEPDEDTNDNADPGDEAALDKDIPVLQRAKIPMSVIKKMANKEIHALATELRSEQAFRDNEFRELGEFRKTKESAAADKARAGESKGTAAPAEQPPSAFDVTRLVEPFSKVFQDPELAAAYGQGLQGIYEAALSQARSELNEAREGLSPLIGLVRELAFKDARSELRERFPGLSKKDKFAEVQAAAIPLLQTGLDIVEAMELASIKVLGAPAQADDARKRNGGQLMTTSKRVSSKPKTLAEAEDAALDVILGGGSRADAERAVRGG